MSPEAQAELVELAGRTAHDFRNLLAVIIGNTELLEEDATDEATAQMLRLIHEAAERGRLLADELARAAAALGEAG